MAGRWMGCPELTAELSSAADGQSLRPPHCVCRAAWQVSSRRSAACTKKQCRSSHRRTERCDVGAVQADVIAISTHLFAC